MVSTQDIYAFIRNSIYVVNFLTIIGSILSFAIFSRKIFSKSTIGIYCKSLAVFDLFAILNFSVGIAALILNSRSVVQSNDWLCKMYNYISPVFSSMCAWILVFFSLDQLITVSMTKRFLVFKKKWFQYSLILGLLAFHLAFISPNLVYAGLVNVGGTTQCLNRSIILPIIVLVESSILPLVTLFIITAVILRYLAQSRNRTFNEFSNTTSSANNLANQRRLKDMKFAFNSVILNIIHIVLTTPSVIIGIIPISDISVYMIASIVGYFFYCLNFALHFWIHLFVNSFFRKELFILLRIKKP